MMTTESIKLDVQELEKQGLINIAQRKIFSWGTHEWCRALFENFFTAIELSGKPYQHLREYDEIIDWMTDTKGKGLLLMGDVGRGKSVVVMKMIIYLLSKVGKTGTPIHASQLGAMHKSKITNYDYLLKTAFPILDEVGVETKRNIFGEKHESFITIVDMAEQDLKPMFLTTNLTVEELMNRYGERTCERLRNLCRVVEFKGESLR